MDKQRQELLKAKARYTGVAGGNALVEQLRLDLNAAEARRDTTVRAARHRVDVVRAETNKATAQLQAAAQGGYSTDQSDILQAARWRDC